MTANEILEIIDNGEYERYGIRHSRTLPEIGQGLENSHQWWQDDPSEWGGACEFNAELGLWDGGELPGVCTIGIPDYPTIESIEKALKLSDDYKSFGPAFLVGGDWAEGGNDIGELIIHNGVCVAAL